MSAPAPGLSVTEVSRRTGISRATLRRKIRSGALPALHRGHGAPGAGHRISEATCAALEGSQALDRHTLQRAATFEAMPELLAATLAEIIRSGIFADWGLKAWRADDLFKYIWRRATLDIAEHAGEPPPELPGAMRSK